MLDSVLCDMKFGSLQDAPLDPESMAASIRALAKSVHGGTSDLFGDLPRPPRQLNMADFGNI